MLTQQLAIKLFLEEAPDPAAVVPIFHRWIQEQSVADERLIDVADYGHVHQGPGVLLTCDGAFYGLDFGEGAPGLLYQRKRDAPGPLADKLQDALGRSLRVAAALENEASLAGTLRFDPSRAEVRVMSRLYADNSPATFASALPDIESALSAIYGTTPKIEQLGTPRECFRVAIQADQARSLAELSGQVAAA